MGLTHLLTAALAATLTTAATLPLSPRIPAAPRIKTVSFTGKGCPLNQGTATVSGSASGLTLSLNQFNVTSGLGGTRMDEIKACEAAITIDDGVSGWALAVGSVSHEGTFFGVGDVRLGLSSTTFWQSSVEEAVSWPSHPFQVFYVWFPSSHLWTGDKWEWGWEGDRER